MDNSNSNKDKVVETISARNSDANKINYISNFFYRFRKNIYYNFLRDEFTELVPNLVIIGAQKSGTSSLHNYLDQNPDIFMSKPIKEPGYFLKFAKTKNILAKKDIFVENKDILLAKYMLRGYTGEKYIGESSTYYTLGNIGKDNETAKAIYESNPDTKFIYILRNPLDRIVSSYTHSLERNYIDWELDVFIKQDKNTLLTSNYYYQILPFLEYFDKSQFKILIFEDFVKNTKEYLNEIAEFLDVSPFKKDIVTTTFNKSKIKSNLDSNQLLISSENKQLILSEIFKDLEKMESIFDLDLIDFWGLRD